jgi:2-polyprenyl-3-methyl-5-hydroxy-6-metoxy-1,4-benzoquinol methylase
MVKQSGEGPLEKQYSKYFEDRDSIGNEILGSMASNRWRTDSKLLGVTLSRYKFVSKMLTGFHSVLEIGAADGWYSRVVLNEVQKLTLSDFDQIWLQDFENQEIYKGGQTDYLIHDFTEVGLNKFFDGIYALDVLEHIQPAQQDMFLSNICASLEKQGVAIFGMPSAESQKYASEGSKLGHVNCQSGEELRTTMKQYFENVFLFSMSDEVVHTGFLPMAHYLIAVCVGPLLNVSPK